MSYIEWTNEYSVNVKQMDDEHKKLFALLDEYYEAMSQKRTKEAMAKIMKGLLDYATYHFGDEEKLMLQHGFAGYPEQREQHAYFLSTVQDYQKRLAEGKLLLSVEITSFLRDWLVKHIQAKDKQYGPFLNEKGVH